MVRLMTSAWAVPLDARRCGGCVAELVEADEVGREGGRGLRLGGYVEPAERESAFDGPADDGRGAGGADGGPFDWIA